MTQTTTQVLPDGLMAVGEVLSWRNAREIHRAMQRQHLHLLEERYEGLVKTFVRAGVGDRLQRLTTALPQAARMRLLLAPESVRRILYGPATDLHFFLASTMAEHRRLHVACPLDEPVWTALGDHRFPAAAAGTPSDGTAPYEAPRLPGGLPMDTCSPHAGLAAGPWYFPFTPYRNAEVRCVFDKLHRALEVIGQVSPPAEDLITSHVKVVVVRKDTVAPNSDASFSSETTTGRVAFTNLQAERVDLAAVVDGLVHESIHSFLYIAEERFPILRRRDVADTLQVESPWSGRALHLHSFTHACFVWFGLWQFWRRAAARPSPEVLSPDRVDEMMTRARSGFDRPVMDVALRTAANYVAPSGTPLLDLIEDVRRGYYD